jgi:GAF domain-containing protein
VVVVLGLGRTPTGTERSLLLASMVAAMFAALVYIPARVRLTDLANRLVYGERTAPDEALRTWGSRLTRAIPLDELLLQLAESLRKTMNLAAAEVWTGTDGRLELTAGVPHRDVPAIHIGKRERAVVARAGVSGGTWIDVWLPELTPRRETSLVRVGPIAHAGELLGLIVLERRPDSDPLSEEDDRVVVELARQVALALHNVQLDSALQQSLEDLRRTNDDLRESRLRIVSAGDAERRRLERDLHDGAQQHLVAMAVKLRLAEDLTEEDPTGARDLPSPAVVGRLAGGTACSRHPSGTVHQCRARRGRPLPARGGSSGVLLLPRSDAERRQTRRGRRQHPRHRLGHRHHASFFGARRRSRVRPTRLGVDGTRLQVTSAPGAGTTVSGEIPL